MTTKTINDREELSEYLKKSWLCKPVFLRIETLPEKGFPYLDEYQIIILKCYPNKSKYKAVKRIDIEEELFVELKELLGFEGDDSFILPVEEFTLAIFDRPKLIDQILADLDASNVMPQHC